MRTGKAPVTTQKIAFYESESSEFSRTDGFDCEELEPDITFCATLVAIKTRLLIGGVNAKVLLLLDLVFTKPGAFKYRFDVRNHLRVTARVRNRVTVIKTELIGVLAHNVLNSTGFALPIRFCPGPANGWYVGEPFCA